MRRGTRPTATRRGVDLVLGLVLFGAGLWLGLVAGLGVAPWEVLTGGLSEQLGTSFGRTSIALSVVVLLVGLAAGVRPGIGTLVNVVLIGATIDVLLATGLLAGLDDGPPVLRLLVTLLGIGVVAVGSALYLGARLGPGPRDGLMLALATRTGWRVGTARAVLECSVLLTGTLLGGPVGPGTVLFAFGIGPAVQVAVRLLRRNVLPHGGQGSDGLQHDGPGGESLPHDGPTGDVLPHDGQVGDGLRGDDDRERDAVGPASAPA